MAGRWAGGSDSRGDRQACAPSPSTHPELCQQQPRAAPFLLQSPHLKRVGHYTFIYILCTVLPTVISLDPWHTSAVPLGMVCSLQRPSVAPLAVTFPEISPAPTTSFLPAALVLSQPEGGGGGGGRGSGGRGEVWPGRNGKHCFVIYWMCNCAKKVPLQLTRASTGSQCPCSTAGN